jgi:hypothetical protein
MRPRRPDDPTLPQLAGYEVQRIPGARTDRAYVCPSCGAAIPPGLGHVVAWPDGSVDLRRHWHVHCWRIAARRGRAV